ncbi:MAG: protein kinase [Thermoguttaceae bacterium]
MNTSCSVELLESALAGELPPEREELLHRHLKECETCATALEQMAGGEAGCREAAAMFNRDELDDALSARAEWSDVDFTVEHLEPSDEPGVLGRLGGYDVLEIIGRGGMGVVLKAFDRELKRCVAIKVLSPHLAQSALAKKRFAREAQAAAAVVHPHVLAIHQVQAGGRLPFLVMPLVAGESLAQRLTAQGRLELKETLRIGMQVAAGLAAAHEQGLVHRDVKPANILLEKGVERAVITDFGLARAADDASLTKTGIIAGTPQYMSPEQARGESVDQRSDLFSLGSVLYAMCTGRAPFRAETSYGVLRRITDEEPRPIRQLNPDIPEWLCRIVAKLMSKQPGDRFQSAREVAGLLEECLAHVQQPTVVPLPAALPKPAPRRAWRPPVIRWKGALAMIAALGAGLLGVLLLSATPPDIAGQWTGEDWGQVVLKKTSDAEYTGTYSETVGKQPGEIQLKWSRIERRFNGTWREGEDRFGELSVRRVGDEIRGALTTDPKSKINPATPRLADLTWTKAVSNPVERQVQAKPKPTFGPVIERVLPFGVPCRQQYFQFRSGEVFIEGNGPGTTAEEDERDRKKIEDAGGVDMTALSLKDRIRIAGEGCIFTQDVQGLDWEKTTAEDVVERMPHVSWSYGIVEPKNEDLPVVYLFKTSRGEVGLMEVLSVVEDERGDHCEGEKGSGMKFRYKLVQGGAAKTASAAKPATPNSNPKATAPVTIEVKEPGAAQGTAAGATRAAPPAFGPVIERTVAHAIDLDTGRLEVRGTTGLLDRARLEKYGVDLVHGGSFLSPVGLKLKPLRNEDWDRVTPAQLAASLASVIRSEFPDVGISEGELATMTFAFQTRKGGIGVLQTLGPTEDGAGFKIRYKLIQPSASQPSIDRATAGGDKAVVEGTAPAHARIWFYAGGNRGNGWSCGFPKAARFTATLELGGQGLSCRVVPESGARMLTLEGLKQIGTCALSAGQLVLAVGKPHESPDGSCSVVVGQWTAKSGEKVPVSVSLSPPGPSTTGPLPAAVEAAVKTISTCAEGDPRVNDALVSLLDLDATEVVRELARFLDSREDTVRRAAIYVLWKVKFASIEPAVGGLLRLCKHQEDLTRGMAALALGENHVASSLVVLMTMTSNDPSGYARRCAAYALGFLGDPAATGVLEKALKDPETLVRTNAQAALKMLRQAAAEKAPSPATFGPVIEREVEGAIDFDSGKLTKLPELPASKKDAAGGIIDAVMAGIGWMESEGMDAMLESSESFLGVGMKVEALGNEAWEKLTPQEVRQQLSATRSRMSQTLNPGEHKPATYAFQTREDGTGIVQVLGFTGKGVKIRYKLVQGGATKAASATQPADRAGEPPAKAPSTPQSAATPALLARPPQLRFLAWQDEWQSQQPHGAFHADGSAVTDVSEMHLLRSNRPINTHDFQSAHDQRHPRFLHLWFSHPLLDKQSLGEVTFLDVGGKYPGGPAGPDYTFTAWPPIDVDQMSAAREARDDSDDRLGWLISTVNGDDFAQDTDTVRLRYTLGPWENERQIPPDKDGLFDLGHGSTFDGAGEASATVAFCKISRDTEQDGSRQIGVWAVTKDGRELSPSGWSGPTTGKAVQLRQLNFQVPLAEVAHFRIATRPVRTVEFQNVVREAKPPAPTVLAEICFIEMPSELPVDLAKLDLATIKKKPGVDILSSPKVITASGRDCEIKCVSGTATDALAPAPTGVTAHLRPTLDGETVHYAVKLSVSRRQPPGQDKRTTVQELAHSGDARLDQPVVIDVGKGDKGRRLLVWLVFRRVGNAPLPPTAPTSGSPNEPQGPLAVQIRQALNSPFKNVEFDGTSIDEAVTFLGDYHKIPFQVSEKIEKMPVTLHLKGKDVALAAGLQAIEDKYPSVRFVVRDDGILLTEREVAKQRGYYPAVEFAKSGDGSGQANQPSTNTAPIQEPPAKPGSAADKAGAGAPAGPGK